MIKVIKKGHPVFVKRVKFSELDPAKCSAKFLSHSLKPNDEFYVKCLDSGEIDLRGNKGEYRIISLSAPIFGEEINVEKGDWIRKKNFDTVYKFNL